MLIEFSINNYTSFRDKNTLYAQTGPYMTKYKETNVFRHKNVSILKNLLIFGPNGAGKTRLLNGLGLMQYLVTHGGSKNDGDKLPYFPFALDDESQKRDTEFEILLEKNQTIYNYQFSYNLEKITKEKLSVLRGKKFVDYFARVGKKIDLNTNFFLRKDGKNQKVDNQYLSQVFKRLRDNELFLYLAQQENDLISSEVFNWFKNDLMFVNTRRHPIPNNFLELMKNPDLKDEMIKFLQFADFNISDIEVDEEIVENQQENDIDTEASDDINPQKKKIRLYVYHKVYNPEGKVIGKRKFSLGVESIGTQRIFFFVLAIMYSQYSGNKKTIVIDEFEDSLHYEMVKALVEIFNSKENNNQFIISTHSLELLKLKIRADQIYLVEKNFMGVSSLKSIFDFKDENNKRSMSSIQKKYIRGRFGALPLIDVDSLEEVLENVHKIIKKGNNESK